MTTSNRIERTLDANGRLVAAAFSSARRSRQALFAFPGVLPVSREKAYAVQDANMNGIGASVVGWKVAQTAPAYLESFGEERLCGPVFDNRLHHAQDNVLATIDAFKDGFAAVEAEFIATIADDLEPFGRKLSAQEASLVVSTLHVGVEFAGSSLASINDLGPLAVVSDCGNNDGVFIGPEISEWRTRPLSDLVANVSIDGQLVGSGSAANVRGGPMEAVAFLIWHLEQRGRALKAGQIISTGAATGIHRVQPGQKATVDFGRDGCILLDIL